MVHMTIMDDIVALCKRRGFVYPTSDIYGGLMSSYDYGPAGAELMRNIRNAWWNAFIHRRTDMVGLDSQILLHPKTWEASGHVTSFSDPLVEDKKTHKRYRADHLIETWLADHPDEALVVEDLSVGDMAACIAKHDIKSPEGNEITEPKKFNLLFETKLGVVEDEKALLYLRGETAQGIFTNFKNILNSNRVSLPFGVGQIGKSFRNEVTTGQFVFRTLEFEQAEIEYFFDPEAVDWKQLMEEWKSAMWSFVVRDLGIPEENVRWRRHTDRERSHYSRDTYDLDYKFPFGWKELWGIAYRTDYDMMAHANASRTDFTYTDPVTNRKFVPHVIEPAGGINRMFFMILAESYRKEEKRIVLALKPSLAPYTAAVFPLVANKPDIMAKAQDVFRNLSGVFRIAWDARGNIGKRYLSQDEIGTPWCVTVDYATLEDGTVTVRDRDTTEQVRVSVDNLASYIQEKLTSR